MLLEDYGVQIEGAGRRYLERLQAKVRHMEHLVPDLLALSRVGRESRPPEVVDLDDFTWSRPAAGRG